MKERLANRLAQLQSEFESGQKVLADLDARKAELQATLLRISGAIQVLQELMDGEAADEASHDGSR